MPNVIEPTPERLPDGLSAGQILMALIESHRLPRRLYEILQDIASVFDLDEHLESLSDNDRRLCVGRAALTMLCYENAAEALLSGAQWVEHTAAGQLPCDDPAAVAGGLRVVADFLLQPIAGAL